MAHLLLTRISLASISIAYIPPPPIINNMLSNLFGHKVLSWEALRIHSSLRALTSFLPAVWVQHPCAELGLAVVLEWGLRWSHVWAQGGQGCSGGSGPGPTSGWLGSTAANLRPSFSICKMTRPLCSSVLDPEIHSKRAWQVQSRHQVSGVGILPFS